MSRYLAVLLFALFASDIVFAAAPALPESPALSLSPAEEAWLRDHPTIRIAGPRAFPPFHFVTDGQVQGMAVDYLAIVAKKLGLQLDYQTDLTWSEVLAGMMEQRLDLIACSAKSAERESFMSLTSPHLSFPLVILTRRDAPFVAGLSDLTGLRIALTRGIMTRDWLTGDGLAFMPVEVNTLDEELLAVADGRADAAVQNLAAASYYIEKRGLTNLKVAAPTPYGNYDLAIGVRKDWPELVVLLNKALASIKQEQHTGIRQRWMAVRFEHGLQLRDLLLWTGAISLVAGAVIAIVYRTNRRLSLEIAERHRVESNNHMLIQDLQQSLAENRTLKGILPLCSYCKKIRTSENAWEEVDVYIHKNSQADISHGICPDCLKTQYPEYHNPNSGSAT